MPAYKALTLCTAELQSTLVGLVQVRACAAALLRMLSSTPVSLSLLAQPGTCQSVARPVACPVAH